METQNVTLAIPKDILRKAKIMAVEKGISLTGLLTQALTEIVMKEEKYREARRRNCELLDEGLDLGTGGNITWKREDLHER
jgi:hypothetical protein